MTRHSGLDPESHSGPHIVIPDHVSWGAWDALTISVIPAHTVIPDLIRNLILQPGYLMCFFRNHRGFYFYYDFILPCSFSESPLGYLLLRSCKGFLQYRKSVSCISSPFLERNQVMTELLLDSRAWYFQD